MPDLQPPQSLQTAESAATASGTAAGVATGTAGSPPATAHPGSDPLTGLKKMSTTAGLGSADYVAISPLAIVALLVGLASVLVPILNGKMLLLIPAAGVVCALVAFNQIRRSNGTLTGRGIAAAGLGLSILIGGGVVASRLVTDLRFRPDRQQIADLIQQLGREVAAAGDAARAAPPSSRPAIGPQLPTAAEAEADRHYDAAYKLFSPKFRARVDEEKFRTIWGEINKSTETGIRGMRWNEHVDFDTDTGTGSPVAWAMALLELNRPSDPPREPVELTKSGGTWQIDDLPNIFRPEKTPRKAPKPSPSAKGPGA